MGQDENVVTGSQIPPAVEWFEEGVKFNRRNATVSDAQCCSCVKPRESIVSIAVASDVEKQGDAAYDSCYTSISITTPYAEVKGSSLRQYEACVGSTSKSRMACGRVAIASRSMAEE